MIFVSKNSKTSMNMTQMIPNLHKGCSSQNSNLTIKILDLHQLYKRINAYQLKISSNYLCKNFEAT